ncbi:MAG: extracellular solute-binding protein, partial [Desulfurococcaceae archaeon]
GKSRILCGIPYDVQTFGIYYNKKIFRQMGIEVPNWLTKDYPDAFTRDEFYDICDMLKRNGIEPIAFAGGETWYYIFPFYFAILQFQKDPVEFAINSMKGRIRYEGPEYEQIFEEAKNLSKYFAEGFKVEKESTAASLYTAGKTAMFIGGTWARRYMIPVAPPDFPWGVFPVPYNPPLHGGTFGGTSPSWAILSTVKGEDLEVLKDFIMFVCEDTNILTYTSIDPGVGLPFKSTYKDEVIKLNLFRPAEIFNEFLRISEFAKVWLDWVYEPEIVTAITTEISNVIMGIHTPKEASREVQRVHDKLVKEGKAYYPQE